MIPVEKAGTLHRHRLLVVEDEVLVLIDTADFVRSQGFEVHERYQPKDERHTHMNGGTANKHHG